MFQDFGKEMRKFLSSNSVFSIYVHYSCTFSEKFNIFMDSDSTAVYFNLNVKFVFAEFSGTQCIFTFFMNLAKTFM